MSAKSFLNLSFAITSLFLRYVPKSMQKTYDFGTYQYILGIHTLNKSSIVSLLGILLE